MHLVLANDATRSIRNDARAVWSTRGDFNLYLVFLTTLCLSFACGERYELCVWEPTTCIVCLETGGMFHSRLNQFAPVLCADTVSRFRAEP